MGFCCARLLTLHTTNLSLLEVEEDGHEEHRPAHVYEHLYVQTPGDDVSSQQAKKQSKFSGRQKIIS